MSKYRIWLEEIPATAQAPKVEDGWFICTGRMCNEFLYDRSSDSSDSRIRYYAHLSDVVMLMGSMRELGYECAWSCADGGSK